MSDGFGVELGCFYVGIDDETACSMGSRVVLLCAGRDGDSTADCDAGVG